MLRVFKPQSAMSVGSWTLTAFSGTTTLALVPAASAIAGSASALLGTAMVTYTGVLLGATAIPIWNQNVRLLPVHFAASGLGSAAALLTLLGHEERALNDIAIGAAAAETLIGAVIEARETTGMAPLRVGASGIIIRAGGVLSGPVPLLCRTVGRTRRWRRVASVCALAGSVLTRIGWIAAGRASAARP
jgi:formate-dependent nitrite reductase membrane component NrfD